MTGENSIHAVLYEGSQTTLPGAIQSLNGQQALSVIEALESKSSLFFPLPKEFRSIMVLKAWHDNPSKALHIFAYRYHIIYHIIQSTGPTKACYVFACFFFFFSWLLVNEYDSSHTV